MYNLRQRFAMIWRYDERGRLIGEHMYEAKAFCQVVSLVADEYLTVQDARARLVPLLRPLPKFVPSPG
jgi:YD repeat-containing protein